MGELATEDGLVLLGELLEVLERGGVLGDEGALLELGGDVLEAVGAGFAEVLSGMTTREAMFLFFFATVKGVDDHCGYRLPFDPLQRLTSNNADYHDIHHQVSHLASGMRGAA